MKMEDIDHMLCRPRSRDEWLAYHAIRRTVLFENRGHAGQYIENHPDEFRPGHHPLILIHNGATVGVVRVDVSDRAAWFRRVAIRQDLQRRGYGRTLLRLAETFARGQGCNEVRSNVATDAVGFYERCGYLRDVATESTGSVTMRKALA